VTGLSGGRVAKPRARRRRCALVLHGTEQ